MPYMNQIKSVTRKPQIHLGSQQGDGGIIFWHNDAEQANCRLQGFKICPITTHTKKSN